MKRVAFFAPLVPAALIAAACVGNDPSRVDDDDRGDAGETLDAAADVTSPTQDADIPPEFTALCGTTTPTACGNEPSNEYGTPAMHVDACKLGGSARDLTTWPQRGAGLPPLTRYDAAGVGGVYCPNALNARPAVVFKRHGFALAPAEATALDTTGEFAIVAVMSYVGVNTPDSQAAGIVFQRNASTAPHFPGPQLAANFAYAATPGSLDLVETTNLGVSLQFGTNGGDDGTRSISAVSPSKLVGPLVVVARQTAGTLTLRVNGQEVSSDTLPPGFSATGSGLGVNIGRAGGEKNYFDGAIGELLFYSTPLPEAQGAALETSLRAKWGI